MTRGQGAGVRSRRTDGAPATAPGRPSDGSSSAYRRNPAQSRRGGSHSARRSNAGRFVGDSSGEFSGESDAAAADHPTGDTALAFIALGANLGDRAAALRRAVERLAGLGAVEAVSPVYETDPVGYLEQPPFLNAVVRLRTPLAPTALLDALQRIEADAGRVRTFRNAPRTLDLDVLLYDDLILDDPLLTLPHPRLHERAFVLVPLHDLAPDLLVPGLDRSVRDLLRELGPTAGVRLYTED